MNAIGTYALSYAGYIAYDQYQNKEGYGINQNGGETQNPRRKDGRTNFTLES
jgi:hypothetical protein